MKKKKKILIREEVRHSSVSLKSSHHRNLWLAPQTVNQPCWRVRRTPLVQLLRSHALLSLLRHASAGTPRGCDGVVVIHAADGSASVTTSRRTDRRSSPRMELSSDRALATLEMSQSKGQGDEAVSVDGDYESLPPHASVVTHMTAGAVAGILEHTVMYPVDSVKVSARATREPPTAQPAWPSLPPSPRGAHYSDGSTRRKHTSGAAIGC